LGKVVFLGKLDLLREMRPNLAIKFQRIKQVMHRKSELVGVSSPLFLTVRATNLLRPILESKGLILFDYKNNLPQKLLRGTTPAEIAATITMNMLKNGRGGGKTSISEICKELARFGYSVSWEFPENKCVPKWILKTCPHCGKDVYHNPIPKDTNSAK
jgi:hypothetical protein